MLGRKKIYKGSTTNKLGPREQRKDQSREDEKNKTKTSTLCNNAFSLSLSLFSLSLSARRTWNAISAQNIRRILLTASVLMVSSTHLPSVE